MYEENRRFLEEKSFSVHPPFNIDNNLGTKLKICYNPAHGPNMTKIRPLAVLKLLKLEKVKCPYFNVT